MVINGADGPDVLAGGVENDSLNGFKGNDTLTGGGGADTLTGGAGDDVIDGGDDLDTASYYDGFAGVTVTLATPGVAQNTGGSGVDTLFSIERLVGTSAADSLTGSSAADSLEGGGGSDTLRGGDGGDFLYNQSYGGQSNHLYGEGGDDRLYVYRYDAQSPGQSLLSGGSGNDILSFNGVDGYQDNVTLDGGDGEDSISVAAANATTILAGSGNDSLWIDARGGAYDITLGSGVDSLTLTYGTAAPSVAAAMVVEDFVAGAGGDKLDLTTYLASALSGYVAGTNPFATGYLRLVQSGADTLLQVDRDGAGATVGYAALATFKLTTATAFTAYNLGGFASGLSQVGEVWSGTSGDDSHVGGDGADTLSGLAGNDVLRGEFGSDVLIGGAGLDILLGDANNPYAAGGDDSLDGGGDNDFLASGRGNDTLNGGAGDDILFAGVVSGATLFVDTSFFSYVWYTDFGAGTVVIDGGDGIDHAYLIYSDRTASVAFNNSISSLSNPIMVGGAIVGSVINVEQLDIYGGSGDDTLVGGAGHDVLYGNAGADSLVGGGGDDNLVGGAGADLIDGGDGVDTANYYNATAAVTVTLAFSGVAQNTMGAGTDILANIEVLQGSTYSDSLTGSSGADTLSGGGGSDTLRGGDGNDYLNDYATGVYDVQYGGANDRLYGEGGDDSLYVYRTGTIAATQVLLDGGAGNDFLNFASFERAVDTATLDGGDNDDFISVNTAGTTTILAGSGNDTVWIDAHFGNHDVTLGAGVDTLGLTWEALSPPIAAAILIEDFATGANGDQLNLTSYLAGALSGYVAGSNPFTAGYLSLVQSGADTLLQVDRDGAGAAFSYDTLATFKLTTTAAFTRYNLGGFNNGPTPGINWTGTSGDDSQTGGDGADTLSGLAGNDTLQGDLGDDVLVGGSGSDVLLGDVDGYGAFGGNDSLEGGDNNDLLAGGLGRDTLNGGAGDDILIAGAVSGANYVGGHFNYGWYPSIGVGDVQIDGGDGVDQALIVYIDRTGAISFSNANANAINLITVGGVSAGSMTRVEQVTFYAGSGADTLLGGDSSDALYGGAGDDSLFGGGGYDYLVGGAGNDFINGGADSDTASYVDATGAVTVSLASGVAQNTGGAGIDTLFNIEGLQGSAYGDSLTGSSDVNVLTGGGGSDTLHGGDGGDVLNDYVYGDSDLQFGGANDRLYGDGGDDFLTVYRWGAAAATQVLLDGGADRDSLAFEGNGRYLDGATLDGGDGDDTLVVNAAGAATILAGSGNDTLAIDARGGAYDITLGAGVDRLSLTYGPTTTGVASAIVIQDFTTGTPGDRLDLADYLSSVLTGYVAGSDPFASGYLKLVQVGADTALQVDRDGAGVGFGFANLVTFKNTDAASFTMANLGGPTGAYLTGTAGQDQFTGTALSDTISGGDGADYIFHAADYDHSIDDRVTDYLSGDGGDDIIDVGFGDVADGGAGTDTLEVYSLATSAVNIDLSMVGDVQGLLAARYGGTFSNFEVFGFVGSNLNDVIIGTDSALGDNALEGMGGDDFISGKGGPDYLFGGEGNDTLLGGDGADLLVGGTGSNSLSGGAGKDRFWLGDGNNVVDGGDGIDTANYLFATSGVVVSLLHPGLAQNTGPTIDSLVAIENLIGTDYADQLTGDGGANVLNGGSGADTLFGGGGVDSLLGSYDDDTLIAQTPQVGEIYDGGDAFDTLVVTGGTSTLAELDLAILNGHVSDFRSTTLTSLEALTFQTTTIGMAAFTAGQIGPGLSATAVITGDAQTNVVYFDMTAPGALDLSGLVLNQWTAFDAATFTGDIIAVSGSIGDDTITGSSGADSINGDRFVEGAPAGAGGNDVLHGGGGNDILDGWMGADQMFGDEGDDTLQMFAGEVAAGEVADGGAGVDTLELFGSVDVRLAALASLERLSINQDPNGPDATAILETFSAAQVNAGLSATLSVTGSSAADTLRIEGSAGLALNLSGWSFAAWSGSDLVVIQGSASGDSYVGSGVRDQILGDAGNDTLHGGSGADLLYGDGGDDRLYVADGQDTAFGGEGNDTFQYGVNLESAPPLATDTVIDGGPGIDTLDFGLLHAAVTINLAVKASLLDIGFGRLSQTGIENLSGGTGDDRFTGDDGANLLAGRGGNDTLQGGSGADTLVGGTGDDSLDGGGGIDTVTYAGSTSGVTVNLALTTAQNTGGDGIDTLKSVEIVLGSAYADSLTGGASNDSLNGGAGADTLDGGAGKDTLVGGAGDDLYRLDSSLDVIVENNGGGFDTAVTSVSYTLAAGVSVDRLETTAGAGTLNLTGNAFAQTLVGNAGINTLDGKAGADTMIGGAGNDTYIVDNTGDVIVELVGGGYDSVKTSASTYALGAELEVLTYTGTGAFKGTGNGLANVITGGIGIDSLDGGAGADRLVGGLGNDTYVVDSAADVIVENANEGLDLVKASVNAYALGANIENLTFVGAGNFSGFGNALANVITGANGNDALDGKAGADRLVGGLGDDVYYTDNVNDTVVELAGQGNDRVLTTLNSAATAANVETLIFVGAGSFQGFASATGSSVFGAAGNDTLSGGAGADFLGGLAGADILTGNGGADIFYFDGPNTGIDRIADFQVGIDHIELRGNTFGVSSLADLGLVAGTTPIAATSGPTLLYNTATGALFFDADGSDAGAAVQIALLTGKPVLGLGDFLVA